MEIKNIKGLSDSVANANTMIVNQLVNYTLVPCTLARSARRGKVQRPILD
jgi:hypothetical protein